MSTTDPVTFWDGVYAARPASAGPRPNVRLTETITDLPPGDALDLGCGSGGDALFLARRGWHVTAADIDLDPVTWTVERADTPRRIATGPGGRTAEVTDHVLVIRRTA
ncbi:hypothetical protein AB0L06_40860 [Spirillospora sp. NPDC052269]